MTGALLINIIIVVTITAIMLLVAVLLFRKLRENERSKYEFMTIIAHKFRTPLTHIKWSSEGLLSDETDSYKKQSLTDIHASNENLINMTTTLIEVMDASGNKNSAYRFERVNICDMVRSIMESYKSMFHSKNLFISISCVAEELFANIDKSRMEFVLSTLFENACLYTPPGRNITATVSIEHRKVAVSVHDDGIGIDARDMQHLFTKFYRTKEARAMDTEGLGVALYLAKSVMKHHKGSIVAYSEGLGKGSTFSIVMPRAK